MDISKIINQIENKGWVRIPNVFHHALIDEVKKEYYLEEHKFINIQKHKASGKYMMIFGSRMTPISDIL